jgi:hypothetical protein
LNFKFNKSLPIILIIKAIGVTTKKNITPIIIGDIIFPNNNPNLNQSLLKGVKTFELINPKIKKNIAMIIDHILNPSLLIKG